MPETLYRHRPAYRDDPRQQYATEPGLSPDEVTVSSPPEGDPRGDQLVCTE